MSRKLQDTIRQTPSNGSRIAFLARQLNSDF
jgi:hypothetical protein